MKAAFEDLYQRMNGMPLREMDWIVDAVCTLCREHERAGFVEGVKVGIRLIQEIDHTIDSIHAYLMEPQYKLEEDGYFIEKDATFNISDFMRDLEWFYQAMRMHFAFEQMCLGNDEPALTLYEDGKHFAGLPFFEHHRQPRKTFRMSTILLLVAIC